MLMIDIPTFIIYVYLTVATLHKIDIRRLEKGCLLF